MSAVVEDTAVVEKTLDIDDRYRNRVTGPANLTLKIMSKRLKCAITLEILSDGRVRVRVVGSEVNVEQAVKEIGVLASPVRLLAGVQISETTWESLKEVEAVGTLASLCQGHTVGGPTLRALGSYTPESVEEWAAERRAGLKAEHEAGAGAGLKAKRERRAGAGLKAKRERRAGAGLKAKREAAAKL